MENEKLSFFVGSVTDVAVMVGIADVPVGRVAGAIYKALKLGAAPTVRIPHVGEHAEPPAVSVQVTPALELSFATEAVTTTPELPTSCCVNLLVMLTLMEAWMVKSNVKIPAESSAEIAEIVAV